MHVPTVLAHQRTKGRQISRYHRNLRSRGASAPPLGPQACAPSSRKSAFDAKGTGPTDSMKLLVYLGYGDDFPFFTFESSESAMMFALHDLERCPKCLVKGVSSLWRNMHQSLDIIQNMCAVEPRDGHLLMDVRCGDSDDDSSPRRSFGTVSGVPRPSSGRMVWDTGRPAGPPAVVGLRMSDISRRSSPISIKSGRVHLRIREYNSAPWSI